MNLKIVLAICISFIIAFGGLYLAIIFFDSAERIDYKKEFFSAQNGIDEERILLIGSSHIGHLNMTHIISQISEQNSDLVIYNLADNGDSPKFRYDDLNEIIELKPKIVFYGISYRDFNQSIESVDSQNEIFDIKNFMNEVIPEEIKSINPQLLTRKVIRNVLDEADIIKKPTYEISPPNTPFFAIGDLQQKISDSNELQRQLLIVLPSPSKIQIDDQNNEEVDKFRIIIEKLHDEGIQVVIFTTPLHSIYSDEVSDSTKKSFTNILNDISKDKGIQVYEFEDRYVELDIWNNLDHIAYNSDAIIFSHEVAEMISEEVSP